eukprot:27273_5
MNFLYRPYVSKGSGSSLRNILRRPAMACGSTSSISTGRPLSYSFLSRSIERVPETRKIPSSIPFSSINVRKLMTMGTS